jgi:hypothetical protein
MLQKSKSSRFREPRNVLGYAVVGLKPEAMPVLFYVMLFWAKQAHSCDQEIELFRDDGCPDAQQHVYM